MGYDAKALEVMIASPSDVIREREVVRSVLWEWNDIHSRSQKMVLLPVGWDTHSAPDLGGRPQQIINEKLLDKADIVVGIFWTKIGSPTGMATSGSVEEIQRHHRAKKPVMLYFSEMPVVPGSYDVAQFDMLLKFKEWARSQGLVSGFSDPEGFRQEFRRHLQIILRDSEYIKGQAISAAIPSPIPITISATNSAHGDTNFLSPEAIQLLKLAGGANHAMILIRRNLDGVDIMAGEHKIKMNGNREVAKWEAAAHQIHDLGLTRDINGKREIFELNDRGFQAADALSKQ
jgi:hypothetical protein